VAAELAQELHVPDNRATQLRWLAVKRRFFSASSCNKSIFSRTARPAISAKSQLGHPLLACSESPGFLFLF